MQRCTDLHRIELLTREKKNKLLFIIPLENVHFLRGVKRRTWKVEKLMWLRFNDKISREAAPTRATLINWFSAACKTSALQRMQTVTNALLTNECDNFRFRIRYNGCSKLYMLTV